MNNSNLIAPSPLEIETLVRASLTEDIGSGDITATLIPTKRACTANIYSRENTIVCGIPWVEMVYHLIEPKIRINWHVREGQLISADTHLATIHGNARFLLSAERTALNWLQTLSGIATLVNQYTQQLKGTNARLLDTRKTLPNLRSAQKYAVRCGGGYNHRFGLYDAILIKENHITACGSIKTAIHEARRQYPKQSIEVEVENLDQLKSALAADADQILLDNFDLPMLKSAVTITRQIHPNLHIPLEASGNVTLDNIHAIAKTGVDFISVGALTKNIRAIDLSMQIVENTESKNESPKIC